MGESKLHKLCCQYKEEIEKIYKDAGVDEAKIPKVKDLAKAVCYLGLIDKEDMEPEGYSMTGNSYRGRTRDSMGRYSSGRYPMSFDDGRRNLVHRVGDLMMCTSDERAQDILREALERLEMM